MASLAWARFARSVADSLNHLADDLEGTKAPDHSVTTSTFLADLPEVRGSRQQAIVALPGLRTEEGMKAYDIAKQAGTDEYNVYSSLTALERQVVLKRVPGSNPRRWRFVARYRGGPDQ